MNKKKLLALVLAALMSVSTTVVAFADESTENANNPDVISTVSNSSPKYLDEEHFSKFMAAPLVDQAGAIAPEDLAKDYTAEWVYDEDDTRYEVTVKASDVQMHTNGESGLGYWVGIAVIAPEGKEISKVKYGKGDSIDSGSPIELETIGENGQGIAYYIDADSEQKEYDFTIQWFKEDGSSNVGDPITFHIDLTNVTLAESTTVKTEGALKEALKKGGNIVLAGPISVSEGLTVAKNTVLNLGENTLTYTGTGSPAVTVNDGVQLTVTGTGSITESQANESSYTILNNGTLLLAGGVSVENTDKTTTSVIGNFGTMTVENANVTGGRYPVACGAGKSLTVNGGSFKSAENGLGALYANSGSNVELNGGEFMTTTGNTCLFNVNGNARIGAGVTMTADDVSEKDKLIVCDPQGSIGKVVVEEGAEITYNGGSGTLDSNEIADAVKENGGSASVVDPSEEEENDRERSGGDYFGNAKWTEVKAQIAAAEEGDTIEMSGTGLPWFPSSVARALKGVTLEIRKNGVTYTLNGQKIGPITKIWYNFDENLETTLQPVEE